MAALAIYGDESGTSRAFVLSVYIATVDKWSRFEGEWKSILGAAGLSREDGTVQPFHMADFESRHPPFQDWGNEKRFEVFGRLARTICNLEPIGASAVLPLDLYKQWMPVNGDLPPDHCLHRILQYLVCFFTLHIHLIKFAELNRLPEPIPFVLDRNNVSAGMVQGVTDAVYKKMPHLSTLLDTPVFRDKSIVVPIQAADVLAYETMKHADNSLLKSGRSPRKSFQLIQDDGQLPQYTYTCDQTHLQWLYGLTCKYAQEHGLLTRESIN